MTQSPRQSYGGTDGLTRYPDGEPWALRIDSPWPKPGWAPRQEGHQTRAAHAGAPIEFEGSIYEVVRHQETDEPRHWYYLRKWDDRFPLRPPLVYDEASCQRLEEAMAESRRRRQMSIALLLALPFAGLLPAEDQARLEREYDCPALIATTVSAALLLALSIIAFLMALWFRVNGSAETAPWVPRLTLFSLYYLPESILRFWASAYAKMSMGSLPVVLPLEIYRSIRRGTSKETRRRVRRDLTLSRHHEKLLTLEEDAVRPLPGGAFEIMSLLEKPHWTIRRTAIRFHDPKSAPEARSHTEARKAGGSDPGSSLTAGWSSGSWYTLTERSEIETADGPRYLFRLEPVEEGSSFILYSDYTPQEVRYLYHNQLRLERDAYVNALAPLWGTLQPEAQKLLSEIYGFDAERWTLSSIRLMTFLSATLFVVALLIVLRGDGSWGEVIALLAAVFFFWESYVRRKQFYEGRITGSLLGRAAHLLAYPLLAIGPTSALAEASAMTQKQAVSR